MQTSAECVNTLPHQVFTRVLTKLYLVHPERFNIIVIADLNNIGEGQSAKEVMEEIAKLRLAFKAHSVKNNQAKPSVLSVIIRALLAEL